MPAIHETKKMFTGKIRILAALAIGILLSSGTAFALTVADCRGCHGVAFVADGTSYLPLDNNSTNAMHHDYEGNTDYSTCVRCHINWTMDIHDCFNCHVVGEGHPNCISCHSSAQPSAQPTRRAVSLEFSMASHHVQTQTATPPTNEDCKACHDTSAHKGGYVKLRVRGSTTSVEYTVTYTNDNSATPHCLSCHNESGKNTTPFSDGKTPENSAWDGKSIDIKYSSTEVVSSNKYPPTAAAPNMGGLKYNTVPDVPRALSAHGNPAMNQANGDALDRQVPCLSCHNAHGSPVPPLLYSRGSYTPASMENFCWDCHNNERGSPRAGDFLGNDIVQDYWGGPNWGMNDGTGFKLNWVGSFPYKNSSFESSHLYPSNLKKSDTEWTRNMLCDTSNTNCTQMTCTNCHDPHGVDPNQPVKAYMVPMLKGTWLVSPYKEDRAPLSSFASPLRDVKNKYSPGDQPRSNPDLAYNNTPNPGGGYMNGTGGSGHEGYFIDENTFGIYDPITRKPAVSGSWNSVLSRNQTLQINRIAETDNLFAGLCLQCHPKTDLVTAWPGHKVVKGWGGGTRDLFPSSLAKTSGNDGKPSSGMHGMGRYSSSQSEEGAPYARGYRWGVNPKTQQTSGYIQKDYHQFPCSKCHTPHAANNPGLLVTNCLDSAGNHTTYPLSETALANNCHSTARNLAWNTLTPYAQTYTIVAGVTGTGGTISPAGNVSVNAGASQTFSIAPSLGYSISSVSVDGVSKGAVSSHTFSNIAANHTINAAFVVTPVNLALNKAASASSTRSSFSNSYIAAKAVDGSASTSWMSSTTSTAQWVRVDLGSSMSISNVKVTWPATYYARRFQIQTSIDGANWTTQYTTPSDATGTLTNVTYAPVSARYVRVNCTTRNNSSYYGVAELQVYQ